MTKKFPYYRINSKISNVDDVKPSKMLAQGIISINVTRECFAFVPLQDFTKNSDIDRSKSIAEIDAQLYRKYELTDEEINFIESMIKPM